MPTTLGPLLRHWRAVVALAAAGVLGIAVAIWAGRPATPAPAPAKEEPPAVAAMGRIEPKSEVININAGTPDRLESLLVVRGERVQEGQVLGYLQQHDVEVAQRDEIAAELQEAKAQLVATTAADEARIADAEAKLRQVDEVEPLQIKAREADVHRLESVLANDIDIARTDANLAQSKITSRRTREDHLTAVLVDKANLKSASARLDELKGRFETDHLAAEAELRLAKATLERDRANIPIDSLAQRLALAKARVRDATLFAPIDGRILNVFAHPGEQVGQIDGNPILSLGDTDHMRVVAEVYETDVSRVGIGDPATITARSLARPLTGRVAEIGQMIFKNDVLNVDPAARADARVVEVRIDLDDPAPVARLTNMTVDVVIEAGKGKAEAPAVAVDP